MSVAKVSAAWRKNIYQTRDVTPQKSVFNQLIWHPNILRDTAIAFYAKHLNKIEGQTHHHKNYEDYRRFKGLA